MCRPCRHGLEGQVLVRLGPRDNLSRAELGSFKLSRNSRIRPNRAQPNST